MTSSGLTGPRDFTHVQPKGRRLTEYEAVVCHLQPGPHGMFGQEAFYASYSDGRPLWDEQSTSMRSSDWFAFRDPAQLWQRPYVALQDAQERAISQATETAKRSRLLATIDTGWLRDGIARLYHAYGFCEKGLSRALSFAQREALSDTVAHLLIFESTDKVRHVQDIVLHGAAIEDVIDGFDAQQGRMTWLEDPSLRAVRDATEKIMSTNDWLEIAFAINLFFDRLVGEAVLRYLLLEGAQRHGDFVTPVIAMTVARDRQWALEGTRELAHMLLTDPKHAAHNADVMQAWTHRWSTACLDALDGLLPLLASTAGFGSDRVPAVRTAVVDAWQDELDRLVPGPHREVAV